MIPQNVNMSFFSSFFQVRTVVYTDFMKLELYLLLNILNNLITLYRNSNIVHNQKKLLNYKMVYFSSIRKSTSSPQMRTFSQNVTPLLSQHLRMITRGYMNIFNNYFIDL